MNPGPLSEAGFLFGLAFLGSVLTPWFWNRRLRGAAWIDSPRADRHSGRAVPRTGGASWTTGTVGALLVAGEWGLGLVALLAFLLGMADDRDRLGPRSKAVLMAVLLLGFVLLSGAWGWGAPDLAGRAPASDPASARAAWLLPFAAASIVAAAALQLALQIFDNMDGALGTVAAIGSAALVWGVTAGSGGIGSGPPTEELARLAGLAAIGAGSSFGFLFWNRPPARVFLGNAGSTVVSLYLAGLVAAVALASLGRVAGPDWGGAEGSRIDLGPAPVSGDPTGPAAGAPALGLAALWPFLPFGWPLFDLVFVVSRRLRAGRAPWVGGRDHTTHALSRFLGGDFRAWLAIVLATLGLAYLALRLWFDASGGV